MIWVTLWRVKSLSNTNNSVGSRMHAASHHGHNSSAPPTLPAVAVREPTLLSATERGFSFIPKQSINLLKLLHFFLTSKNEKHKLNGWMLLQKIVTNIFLSYFPLLKLILTTMQDWFSSAIRGIYLVHGNISWTFRFHFF